MSVQGLPPLPPIDGVVQFTAGLIYGMTGDNHLDELTQCMDVSQPILDDIQKLIDDASHFQIKSVITDIGDLIWQMPIAFQSCTAIQDDLEAIEEWAQIFKQPVKLAETIAKNWLIHGVAIEADITSTENDWNSEEYYNAGVDAADALVKLFGPIKDLLTLAPQLIPELFGGFIYGMHAESAAPFGSADEMKSYFDSCYVDNAAADQAIQTAIDNIQAAGGDQDIIIENVQAVIAQIPAVKAAFSGCDQETANLDAVYAYVDYVRSLGKDGIIKTALPNVRKHFKDIKALGDQIPSTWAAGDYFKTGDLCADIGEMVLPSPASVGFASQIIPELFGGFIYGMHAESAAPFGSADEMKSYFDSCYVENVAADQAIQTAIDNIQAAGGDQDIIIENVQAVIAQIPAVKAAFSGCDQEAANLDAVYAYVDYVRSLGKDGIIKTALPNVRKHFKDIKALGDQIPTVWAAGDYFKTGDLCADIGEMVLPSPQATAFLQ